MKASSDKGYINKYPDDAAEIAELVRRADLETAISLLQIWGSQQADRGMLAAIERFKDRMVS